LVEEILHQLIGSLSHYLQGFIYLTSLKKHPTIQKAPFFFCFVPIIKRHWEALLGESSLVMK